MIYKCPKCKSRTLEKSRRGYHLRCSNLGCGYVSEPMSKEEVLKVVNNVPSDMDLMLEEIEENSKYIDELYDEYIKKDDVLEIIEKYKKLFDNKEAQNA